MVERHARIAGKWPDWCDWIVGGSFRAALDTAQ
jgi:hypothetical protein